MLSKFKKEDDESGKQIYHSVSHKRQKKINYTCQNGSASDLYPYRKSTEESICKKQSETEVLNLGDNIYERKFLGRGKIKSPCQLEYLYKKCVKYQLDKSLKDSIDRYNDMVSNQIDAYLKREFEKQFKTRITSEITSSMNSVMQESEKSPEHEKPADESFKNDILPDKSIKDSIDRCNDKLSNEIDVYPNSGEFEKKLKTRITSEITSGLNSFMQDFEKSPENEKLADESFENDILLDKLFKDTIDRCNDKLSNEIDAYLNSEEFEEKFKTRFTSEITSGLNSFMEEIEKSPENEKPADESFENDILPENENPADESFENDILHDKSFKDSVDRCNDKLSNEIDAYPNSAEFENKFKTRITSEITSGVNSFMQEIEKSSENEKPVDESFENNILPDKSAKSKILPNEIPKNLCRNKKRHKSRKKVEKTEEHGKKLCRNKKKNKCRKKVEKTEEHDKKLCRKKKNKSRKNVEKIEEHCKLLDTYKKYDLVTKIEAKNFADANEYSTVSAQIIPSQLVKIADASRKTVSAYTGAAENSVLILPKDKTREEYSDKWQVMSSGYMYCQNKNSVCDLKNKAVYDLYGTHELQNKINVESISSLLQLPPKKLDKVSSQQEAKKIFIDECKSSDKAVEDTAGSFGDSTDYGYKSVNCVSSSEVEYKPVHLDSSLGNLPKSHELIYTKESLKIPSSRSAFIPFNVLKEPVSCNQYFKQKLLKEAISIDRIILKLHAKNEGVHCPQPLRNFPPFFPSNKFGSQLIFSSISGMSDSYSYKINAVDPEVNFSYFYHPLNIKNQAYLESNLKDLSACQEPYRNYETKNYFKGLRWTLDSLQSTTFLDSSSLRKQEIPSYENEYHYRQLNKWPQTQDYFQKDKNKRQKHKCLPSKRHCIFYMKGKCSHHNCKFSHDVDKITCKFWEAGSCLRASACRFLHGYVDKEKVLDEHPKSAVNYLLNSKTDFPPLSSSNVSRSRRP